jgi:hypothetical protein
VKKSPWKLTNDAPTYTLGLRDDLYIALSLDDGYWVVQLEHEARALPLFRAVVGTDPARLHTAQRSAIRRVQRWFKRQTATLEKAWS